jgi:hypothetical protein
MVQLDPPKNPSTVLTRWMIPLAVVWAGVLLSAFTYSKLTRAIQARGEVVVVLFGSPALCLAGLVVLRTAARRITAGAGALEDAVVIVLMLFLESVHATLIASSFGFAHWLRFAMPFLTAILLIVLGPLLRSLSPGSVMGIRTKATLQSTTAWAETHRFTGLAFVAAGIASLGAAWLPGPWALIGAVIPAVFALLAGVVRGLVVSTSDRGSAGSP